MNNLDIATWSTSSIHKIHGHSFPPSQLHQHSLEHSLHVRSIILALVLVDVIFPVSF